MSIAPGDLGHRIRTAREARGLSQKQLADLAGIGKTAMFDLEHGNPGVRLNTLLAVLHILDISLNLDTPESLNPTPPTPPATDPGPAPDDLPAHLL